ncbi:MAG: beta-lactamase family protein [Oscillospiraceae bacterium]|nr:beta-lactamase family protein [Oscillospiraceae bacterium]
MIVDLVSQMKTANLMTSLLQGRLDRCSPYPFAPCEEKPMPDRSLYGLETSTPEAQGVESAWLNGYFCALRDCKSIHVHSVAVLRHGKLIAEGSFKPYTAAFPHMQFSLSKSIVGMAVGMAVGEGLLSVNDHLVDFFADDRTLLHNSKIAAVTIKNLLQMTAGVKYNEVFSVTDRDWVRGYLSSECAFEPGTDFYYNSMNTYMLSAVLHQVTGESLVDYLMPRLFEPMRIPRPRWEMCPMGVEKGGWGIYLRTIDMAKLGQLYLQGGRWGTKQLVPAGWVYDSTHDMVTPDRQSRDSGYGYQLWKFPVSDAFQYSGVYGQHVIILPRLDAVVAMTGGSQTFVTDEASTITEKYFADHADGFHGEPLKPNIHALRRLKDITEHLYSVQETMPPQPPKEAHPWMIRNQQQTLAPQPVPEEAASLDGSHFQMEVGTGTLLPLAMQIVTNHFPPAVREVSFAFTPGMCHIHLCCGEEISILDAGLLNEPYRGSVTFDGETYPVGCSARLTSDEDGRPVLKLFISFLQTPFMRTIKFIFYDHAQKVVARFDEQPSIEDSIAVAFDMMDDADGPQNLFGDAANQKRMNQQLSRISLPKMHGVCTDGKRMDTENAVPETKPVQSSEESD